MLSHQSRGTGLPVVFVHGFPFDSRMWQPQLDGVSDGFRLIAPDLRGFGRSPAPGEGPLTMDSHADDLAALLDGLGIERAVFCGLSMGGYVLFSMWRRHRERVRALVLCSTRADADTEGARANRRALAERALREGAASVADAMIPSVLSSETRENRPDVVALVREMIEGTDPGTIARGQEGMARRTDSTDLLPEINVPTLLLFGSEDPISPVAVGDEMCRSLPDARMVVIPGAAHLPNLEDPAAFNAPLLEFLGAVTGE